MPPNRETKATSPPRRTSPGLPPGQPLHSMGSVARVRAVATLKGGNTRAYQYENGRFPHLTLHFSCPTIVTKVPGYLFLSSRALSNWRTKLSRCQIVWAAPNPAGFGFPAFGRSTVYGPGTRHLLSFESGVCRKQPVRMTLVSRHGDLHLLAAPPASPREGQSDRLRDAPTCLPARKSQPRCWVARTGPAMRGTQWVPSKRGF